VFSLPLKRERYHELLYSVVHLFQQLATCEAPALVVQEFRHSTYYSYLVNDRMAPVKAGDNNNRTVRETVVRIFLDLIIINKNGIRS
jgi:hypothetical protein